MNRTVQSTHNVLGVRF